MILCIADLLSPEALAEIRRALDAAAYVDGRETAGWHARLVKRNRQMDARMSAVLQSPVLDALRRNEVFRAAVLPRRFRPVLFSRYETGMAYGAHVDDAVMGGDDPVRSDVSFTLFLCPPESYAGGELVIETTAGEQAFKLDAGAAVVYPSTTLHRVDPVRSGVREAAVGWAQSLVRNAEQRELLFELDTTRRALFRQQGKTAEFDRLAKVCANPLRMRAEP